MFRHILASLVFFFLFALSARAEQVVYVDDGEVMYHYTSMLNDGYNPNYPAMTADEIHAMTQTEQDINAALIDAKLAGLCNIQALAFANQVFNTTGKAQAKCDELVLQTGGDAADCKVVRLGANKLRAQFRKLLQLNQLNLNQLLQGVVNFVLQKGIFANQQLKLQVAVSNGCG